MAHTNCVLDKGVRMHAGACVLPCARTHALTLPGTHTHTQTNMWYVLLFHSNTDSRKYLTVTWYVHCLSCWIRVRQKVKEIKKTRKRSVDHITRTYIYIDANFTVVFGVSCYKVRIASLRIELAMLTDCLGGYVKLLCSTACLCNTWLLGWGR